MTTVQESQNNNEKSKTPLELALLPSIEDFFNCEPMKKSSPCLSQESLLLSTGKQSTSSIYNFDINKKADPLPEPEGKQTTGSVFNFDNNVKNIGKRSVNVYHFDKHMESSSESSDQPPKISLLAQLRDKKLGEKKLESYPKKASGNPLAFDHTKGHQSSEQDKFSSTHVNKVISEVRLDITVFESIEQLNTKFVKRLNDAFGSPTYTVQKTDNFINVTCVVKNCHSNFAFQKRSDGIVFYKMKSCFHKIDAHQLGQTKTFVK